MNSKKIIYFLIVSLFIFVSSQSIVSAQTVTPTNAMKIKTGDSEQNRLMKAKEKGNRELTRRINALNQAIASINNAKKLTQDQKTSLVSQVQTEIHTLTALQQKINADTDLQTLKTDVQSIVKEYRIFALLLPKNQIIVKADKLLNIADSEGALVTKLQSRITDLQAKGQNVADLQAMLTELQKNLADAKAQAQHAIDTVMPLTSEGYPGNKTSLMSARAMLKSAQRSLKLAHTNDKSVIKGCKERGKKNKITPTLILSPTVEVPTATPTPVAQ